MASYWVDRSDTTGRGRRVASATRDVAIGAGTNRYGSLLADSGGPVAAGTYAAPTATNECGHELVDVEHRPAWRVPLRRPHTKLMVIMEENETTSAYDGMPYLAGCPTPTARRPTTAG